MKKLFLFSMMCLMASPFFTGCGKDSESNGNGGTEPTQQRTEEFIYNSNMKFYRPGSSSKIPHTAFADTVAKYATDQNVKQIHIIPENKTMFENLQQLQMEHRADYLNNTYDASNNKLSGENTTLIISPEAFQSQIVQDAFHNKLKITLVERDY